jgi:hypothetical protein
MESLPPAPPVNRDIPVVTSAGASSAAYNDPNSPEAIMKKTTLVQAQGITDTRFDVPEDAFQNYTFQTNTPLFLIVTVFCLILFLILLSKCKVRKSIQILFLSTLIVLLLLSMKKKNEL